MRRLMEQVLSVKREEAYRLQLAFDERSALRQWWSRYGVDLLMGLTMFGAAVVAVIVC